MPAGIAEVQKTSLLVREDIAVSVTKLPGYPGFCGKWPRKRPDFCDLARIFVIWCTFSVLWSCLETVDFNSL